MKCHSASAIESGLAQQRLCTFDAEAATLQAHGQRPHLAPKSASAPRKQPRPTSAPAPVPPKPVFVVALTGGPCAGKSEAAEAIRRHLQAHGHPVRIASEAATLLHAEGLDLCTPPTPEAQRQQAYTFVRFQLAHEAVHRVNLQQTRDSKLAILLLDRAAPEGLAFVGSEIWGEVMASLGRTHRELVLAQDLVLHLVTTADGALEAFEAKKRGNPARRESSTQAIEQDRCLAEIYAAHPACIRIDNAQGKTAATKLAEAVACVATHVAQYNQDMLASPPRAV